MSYTDPSNSDSFEGFSNNSAYQLNTDQKNHSIICVSQDILLTNQHAIQIKASLRLVSYLHLFGHKTLHRIFQKQLYNIRKVKIYIKKRLKYISCTSMRCLLNIEIINENYKNHQYVYKLLKDVNAIISIILTSFDRVDLF